MTDSFGSEIREQDDTAAVEDPALNEEQAPLSEAPPDEEFADPLSNDEPLEDKQTRRSPLLPVIAALSGIVLLGGAAWWQLGQNPSVPNEEATPFSINNSEKDEAVISSVSPKMDSVAPQALVPEPNQTTEGSSALPSAPTPVTASDAPTLQDFSAAAPAVAAKAPQPAPNAPVAAVALAPAPVSALPLEQKSVPEHAVSLAIPPKPGAQEDPRLEALAARVNALQTALDQATNKLNAGTPGMMVDTAKGSSSASDQDLLSRLEKLEQKVEAIKQQSSSVGATEGDSVRKTVVKKKTSRKGAKQKSTAQTKTAVDAKKTSWVLRAAAPGKVWVSQSSTSLDLKELKVGDNLSGIGKVTAIESKDGEWSVRGTEGSIK